MEIDTSSKYYIPRPGDRIGDNVIVEALAEGGMARIYRVKNEALEVTRVIKLMKPSSDIDADRFVTEARISAKLNHPNIVQCYYFGKFNNFIPYIEMEYVDGTNLYKLIHDYGKLPVPVTISILYFVCKALFALHNCFYMLYNVKRSGIVHRDIKPANILISNDGNVKLADFGIAKPKDLSIHTSAIQIVGSTFYLSPEQLKKEPLDFRTDIYSLGCVIYEMVTSQKAFEQNNISDIVVAKLNNYYSTTLLYRCPEKLKNIIVRCLNPRKDDRYSRIEEVQLELESILHDFSIDKPQQIIYDYIQDPGSFKSPQQIVHKKNYTPLLLKVAVTLSILSLLIFYGFIMYFKNDLKISKEHIPLSPTNNISILDSKEETPTVTPDSIKRQPTDSKEHNKKNKSIKTPLQKKTKKIENNTIPAAILAFKRKNFNKCVSLLSNQKDMNDTLFLCYLGSLAETQNFSQLSKIIKTRSINDGYFHYLKGRIAYQSGNYENANGLFLKALTIRSFYKKLVYFSTYYLAKSKSALYLKQPNTANKKGMLKSFERFTNHFCNNPNSKECVDIIHLFEKYK